MKVEVERKFRPVTVHLTFEKINELFQFYAIFNFAGITEPTAENLNSFEIREAIKTACPELLPEIGQCNVYFNALAEAYKQRKEQQN
jgi:hypothetical protein